MTVTITKPVQESKNKPVFRRYVNQFADGYQQRSKAGINNYIPQWDVKFPAQCSPEECEELWTDLISAFAVDHVLWKSPADLVPEKYLAENLEKIHVGRCGLFEINCTFIRVF